MGVLRRQTWVPVLMGCVERLSAFALRPLRVRDFSTIFFRCPNGITPL